MRACVRAFVRMCVCFPSWLIGDYVSLSFCEHFAKKKGAGCYTLIVSLAICACADQEGGSPEITKLPSQHSMWAINCQDRCSVFGQRCHLIYRIHGIIFTFNNLKRYFVS